jgi:hypothetical protein
MKMRVCVGLVVLALALPAQAETVPAGCDALTSAVQVAGYTLTVPPAGPETGWCVLDGAALRSEAPGRPDVTADRLRLRGSADEAGLVSIEVDLAGLRVLPQAGDRALDDRLRSLFRLQTADLRFSAAVDREMGRLDLRDGVLQLSAGTEVTFAAAGKAAGLSAGSLLGGSLTELDLVWRNDGRLLRPVMEMLGVRLAEGATGEAAVDAARLALRQLVDNLPEATLTADTRPELEQLVTALPQGRGRLALSLSVEDGIGASRLLMAGLSDDPLGPKGLALVLQGARLTALWSPGIAP